MRLIVTGGGTGGHIYPALEVALAAREQGADVEYLGSRRGQEKSICAKANLPIRTYGSEPVYRLHTIRGLKSLLNLLKSSGEAKRDLEKIRPDVIFATGGYSAAPVLNAARKLGIPVVLHEQNSVPGRTILLAARSAKTVCTVFHASAQHFPNGKVQRTGMPIRKAMRESAQGRLLLDAGAVKAAPLVLVMGGSQGSAALNDHALGTALRMASTEVQWLHLTGLSHFESTMNSLQKMGIRSDYSIKAYVEGDEMASAMFNASVALCRSGAGTMAELAAFRKPSVLVPYPAAFNDHQRVNAEEFANLGAAEIIAQKDLDPARIESRILSWLNDADRVEAAQKALAEWDVPDAVPQILGMIKSAAGR